MTVSYDASHRAWAQGSAYGAPSLTDKFECLKDIGDGSFGTVSLARVRNAGSHVARRGTMVAIKTMKKTFESFKPCLELREVIFLRTLPHHPHLVPALDIFLDPTTRRLHIAMEYMDGNLYQLMKGRDHKPFDATTVKSILYQIMLGLQHIHDNGFFHRDIKPENILVSLANPKDDTSGTLNRYSRLLTTPTGPPSYSVKLADFGLAREISSAQPYTTYVSTRWYRAPEVLLRSGYYSAPVDIWALGAMAVEIAALRPIFPGQNEIDQMWRISEIIGHPGSWLTSRGTPLGGGEWREGYRLAHGLGFVFPKAVPHPMNAILPAPEWPTSLCHLISWTLQWDPRNRPTADECLKHDYFTDAIDPLRPKSASLRLHLGRKHSDRSTSSLDQHSDSSETFSKRTSSWLRKSIIARDSTPIITQHVPSSQTNSPRIVPMVPAATRPITVPKRPLPAKRHTLATGTLSTVAPMSILPCIKPISPLSNTVTVEAQGSSPTDEYMGTKKLTRQLSLASCASHQSDARQEAERALNGHNAAVSAAGKDSFFSHLRKKARRLSGRYNLPLEDDLEAGASTRRQNNNKYSTVGAGYTATDPSRNPDFADLDKKLQTVKQNLEAVFQAPNSTLPGKPLHKSASNPMFGSTTSARPLPFKWGTSTPRGATNSPSPTKSRRAVQSSLLPPDQFTTPDEADEIDVAMASAHAAAMALDNCYGGTSTAMSIDLHTFNAQTAMKNMTVTAPYLTPLPTGVSGGVVTGFGAYGGGNTNDKAMNINLAHNKDKQALSYPFPTPPDETEWAQAAAASIFAVGNYWA